MTLFSLYFYALFAFVLVTLAVLSKLAPSKRFLQHALLLAASLVFIAFASWQSTAIILAASFVTWFCGSRKSKRAQYTGIALLLALVSYSLQIYFDFSGYSDLAVGTGKMLGFDLPRNFNMPYLSQNVTEFWRRWHITLSSWIRAYIYIPLGGNRKGKVRQGVNLLIAITLCGLWHGAAWNFVLWGFVHGLALLLHKQFMTFRKRNGKDGGGNPFGTVIFTVLTFAFVSLAWVLFRAETLGQALLVYRRLFSFAAGLNQPYLWSFVSIAVLFAAILATVRNKGEAFYPILNLSKYTHLTAFFVFLGLLFGLCYTGGSPFIYGAF